MAEQPIVRIGENSPEFVAFKLMNEIAEAERITFNPLIAKDGSAKLADRDWILSTYVKCLAATRGAYSKP